MRILFSLFMFFAICCGQAVSQEVAVTPDFGRFNLRVEFEKHYPLTIEILKTEFRGDYATLIAGVSGISWRGGEEASALLAAFGMLKDVRRKYADKLIFAPSTEHTVMVELMGDFYSAVFTGEGPAVCGRFAQDGSGVLFELGLSEKYQNALDQQSAAFFDAVVKAIETPEYAGVAEPGDWATVIGVMVAAGAPKKFVEAISKGDPKDSDLCPALAAVFRISGLLDTPEGKRARADFAKNLSGY